VNIVKAMCNLQVVHFARECLVIA